MGYYRSGRNVMDSLSTFKAGCIVLKIATVCSWPMCLCVFPQWDRSYVSRLESTRIEMMDKHDICVIPIYFERGSQYVQPDLLVNTHEVQIIEDDRKISVQYCSLYLRSNCNKVHGIQK